jgi:NiFe hydrogenase small subunit HydA
VVEGGVPTADGGKWLTIAGKTGIQVLRELAKDAKVVLAVGSCSYDGGVVRGSPNPSQVRGVGEIDGIDTSKLINLPGCPCNPVWVIATVAHLLVMGGVPELDQYRRPSMIYGQLVHDNCERRAHFDAGRFVEEFGSREAELGYCLYKMGCKGPVAYANCPIVRWNNQVNWCVGASSPCIACTELRFVDRHAPFYERLPDLEVPGGVGIEVAANRVGIGVGIATAVGIGVHLAGRIKTGKWGKGSPSESEKEDTN